jgi:hypothetical protein
MPPPWRRITTPWKTWIRERVAFDDLDVHLDVVTGAEGRDVALEGGLVDRIETLHGVLLFLTGATGHPCMIGTA